MKGPLLFWVGLLCVSAQIIDLGVRVDDSTKGATLKNINPKCLANPVATDWPAYVQLPMNSPPMAPAMPLKICDVVGLFPPGWTFLAASFEDDGPNHKLQTSTGESLYFNGASANPPDATAAALWPWQECGSFYAVGPRLVGSCPGLTPAANTSKKYLGLEDGGAFFGWFCTPGAAATLDPGELLLTRIALPLNSSATVSGVISVFGGDPNGQSNRYNHAFTCFGSTSPTSSTSARVFSAVSWTFLCALVAIHFSF